MKKYLFVLFMLCLSVGVRAQAVSNFTASPSSVPLNGIVHIDYDFQNTGSTNITGNIDSHMKVNSLDLGIVNTYPLTAPLLPGQLVHIAFNMSAGSGNNFNVGPANIVVAWPTGTFTEANSEQVSLNVTAPN
ncbi:MAG: hypothetical protein ACTHJ0_12145 [Flavipsychrobacter sp.]